MKTERRRWNGAWLFSEKAGFSVALGHVLRGTIYGLGSPHRLVSPANPERWAQAFVYRRDRE